MRATYPRLRGADVRAVRFRRGPWRRRVDGAEVYAFLTRVADELDLLARDPAVARADADRVRTALRDWQTRNARASDPRWPGGRR